jgi:hypothetical protein
MSPQQYHTIKGKEQMRAESEKIARAFIARKPASAARTMTDGTAIYLHGSKIAWWGDDRSVSMTLAGWPTVTTRDRLNTLCRLLLGESPFSQQSGQQYYDDREISEVDTITVHLISDPPYLSE